MKPGLSVLLALGCGAEPAPTTEAPVCEGQGEGHSVFTAFWQELDERYALFDIRLPDTTWYEVGRAECGKLPAQEAGDGLFDAIVRAAERLDDGHVQLDAPELGRSADGWVSEYPHYEEAYELEFNVEDRYLDDGELQWAGRDWVSWGMIGEVGYVAITSMDSLSRSGDEDDDIDAANEAMTKVLADLGDAQGIIVDVRANEGGWDGVSLAIARRFAGARTVAWSEQVRNGPAHDDFSQWVDTYVEAASDDAFGGPVIVLSGGGTFSAGETFLLAMRVRDNVTVLGEPASGHLSDIYDYTLPNGWELAYSGERYRAADGEIYEAVGIPVDIDVPFDVEAFAMGTDNMLEAALASL